MMGRRKPGESGEPAPHEEAPVEKSYDDEDANLGLSDFVVEDLRSDYEALDENIPTPDVVKPRSERDPDEEIAYTERRLKTKRRLLASMRPHERDKKKVLEAEIAALEADLKFFENKKQRLEDEEKIEDD